MSRMPAEMMSVHEALRRYVAVDDAIFKFSWRRLLPVPGLFKAIPYGQHEQELASIASVLTKNERLLREGAGKATVFSDYVLALLETVEALRVMCRKLNEESKGAVGSYRYAKYREDFAKYSDLAKRYQLLGTKINQIR